MQAPLGFKTRYFGGSSQMQVLKHGVPDVGFINFATQGEVQVCEFLSDLSQCGREYMAKSCLSFSHPLPCGFLSFTRCVGIIYLVFQFSVWGSFSIWSLTFSVSIGRGKYGILLFHCLKLKPLCNDLLNVSSHVLNIYYIRISSWKWIYIIYESNIIRT